jgi:mono/diheme cytochrome c family protein
MQKGKVGIVLGVALVVVGIVVGGRYLIRNQATVLGTVVVPELSSEGKTGERAFSIYCSQCHGKNAAGTDKGPPLVIQIYGPSHHADFSFVRAVTLGVSQHHWLFGNMPQQPEVSRQEIDRIIIYTRELQRANGIQ